jgi:hypothetical protein
LKSGLFNGLQPFGIKKFRLGLLPCSDAVLATPSSSSEAAGPTRPDARIGRVGHLNPISHISVFAKTFRDTYGDGRSGRRFGLACGTPSSWPPRVTVRDVSPPSPPRRFNDETHLSAGRKALQGRAFPPRGFHLSLRTREWPGQVRTSPAMTPQLLATIGRPGAATNPLFPSDAARYFLRAPLARHICSTDLSTDPGQSTLVHGAQPRLRTHGVVVSDTHLQPSPTAVVACARGKPSP